MKTKKTFNKLIKKAEEKPIIQRQKLQFKSKLEEKLYKKLPKKHTSYEGMKLKYKLDRTYIPDFVVKRPGHPDLILESKGYFRPGDRQKMKAVREEHPELDIRFVFAADNKLNSQSKTRYSDWCKMNGFQYCIGDVPHCWIYPGKRNKEYSDNYYKRNREDILKKSFVNKLKKRYGLTVEEFHKLKKDQHNKCAICSTDLDSLPRRPDIDHCHDTGKVRGLLCWSCNGGLGQFNDDPVLLSKAIIYLEKNK